MGHAARLPRRPRANKAEIKTFLNGVKKKAFCCTRMPATKKQKVSQRAAHLPPCNVISRHTSPQTLFSLLDSSIRVPLCSLTSPHLTLSCLVLPHLAFIGATLLSTITTAATATTISKIKVNSNHQHTCSPPCFSLGSNRLTEHRPLR